MSKFDDLCAAFAKARRDGIAEQEACWNLAAGLAVSLKNYLEYPGEVLFQPVISKATPESHYFLPGAMEFSTEDGAFHVGFVLTVYEAPNQFPQFRGLLHIIIKKSGDSFTIRPAPGAPEILVRGSDPGSLAPVNEAIFELIKRTFVPMTSLTGDQVDKKIGFT